MFSEANAGGLVPAGANSKPFELRLFPIPDAASLSLPAKQAESLPESL
jgi:hypothetical protein